MIHVTDEIRSELACEPILVLLHVNLRSGTKANGSSKDKTIEAMMINFPAPAEPPMRATIKLGIIAKHLV